jgi:hypothetical protein
MAHNAPSCNKEIYEYQGGEIRATLKKFNIVKVFCQPLPLFCNLTNLLN